VSIEYENDKVKRIDTVVVSTQHAENASQEEIADLVMKEVILKVLDHNLLDENTKYFINPTGRFVIGGPHGDAGITGRKIIVDTYGGMARHGGGAFSGKDPTKVDRSAAYLARYIAKNIVAAGAAKKSEVQLAYAIGVAKPVSLMIDTFGTGLANDEAIAEYLIQNLDMRPDAIIRRFDLLRPIYKSLAAYGHMGREDLDAPWEKTDLAERIRAGLGL